jgi:hypothetical protein
MYSAPTFDTVAWLCKAKETIVSGGSGDLTAMPVCNRIVQSGNVVEMERTASATTSYNAHWSKGKKEWLIVLWRILVEIIPINYCS